MNTFLWSKYDFVKEVLLWQPQLEHNSTQPQPNITLVGFDMKMTLDKYNHPPAPPNPPQKLNVSNISVKVGLWDQLQQQQ